MLRHLGATLPETVLERSVATILARASRHAQSGEETVPHESEQEQADDSELYRLDFADYERLAPAHPRQTCDLLFAIGRVVALRLRHSRLRPSKS
jgi:hypothetical protein